jgi:hypothetical protein
MSLQIQDSSEIGARHLKIAFWGPTGSRKTETILRNFPDCLLIDSEGNGEMCANHPDIPAFTYARTKDPFDVIEAVDGAASGRFKMKNGHAIQTVAIDGASVLWANQQEVAYGLARKRSEKRGQPGAESTNPTQGEWATAKRPLRMLMNRLSASPIKYLIFTAREKDLYADNKGSDMTRIGVQPEWVKGSDFDMNIIFHFFFERGVWMYEITKVQGFLGKILPMGSKGSEFPLKELLSYALSGKVAEDNATLTVEQQIQAELARPKHKQRSFRALQEYAQERGLEVDPLKSLLKAAGFLSYTPDQHDQMEVLIDTFAAQQINA